LLALGNTEAIYDKMDTLWDNTKKEIMGALDAETPAYTKEQVLSFITK